MPIEVIHNSKLKQTLVQLTDEELAYILGFASAEEMIQSYESIGVAIQKTWQSVPVTFTEL